MRHLKTRAIHASIFLDKFVELLPHVRYEMELDDLSRDRPLAGVHCGKMSEEIFLGLL